MPQYDELLSSFAFNFNLRRYTEVIMCKRYNEKVDVFSFGVVVGAYPRSHFSST
jgi:hypothetical protein